MISEHIMRTHALSGTINSSSSSSSSAGGVSGRSERAGGTATDRGGSQSGSQKSIGTGRQEDEMSSHSTLSQRLRSAVLDYEGGQRDSTYSQDDIRTYNTILYESNHTIPCHTMTFIKRVCHGIT